MAAATTEDDHEMEEQSDLDEESKGDIQYNEGDSQLNGQHVAESSTPTDYSLYDLPPRLAVLRQQIHDLDHQIELPKVDWELILPYLDNVWRKLKSSEQTEASQNSELYWCKLRKASNVKTHQPRPTPEGKQARKRKPKEEKACGMAMKVTYSSGALDKVTIQKLDPRDRHTHDLDFMDAQKRNSGIMNTARKEAIRGFQPASIWWKMQTEPEKLEAAGGKFMKISDVRNVQYQWRQEHPDMPLKSHTGYNAARAGPRPAQPGSLTRQKSSPRNVTAQPVQPHPTYYGPPQPQQPGSLPPPPHYQHHPPAPPPPQPASDVLHFPPELRNFLIPYLPNHAVIAAQNRPHVTLTWAQSLDGRIASSPGYRTRISGPETKAMTHFLRSAHDAILIGVRTAITDDPGLNCRLSGAGGYGGPGRQWQPRPIIVDPSGRLIIRPEMKILQIAQEGRAQPPWIVVGPSAKLNPVAVSTLKAFGGEYLMINEVDKHGRFSWEGIFQILYREGIKSVMVEGGGQVLSELLRKHYTSTIDSVIMTIAPTFLGSMGVQVTQETELDAHRNILQNRLRDVYWQAMGPSGDAVICGRLEQPPPPPPKSNGILQGIVEMANNVDGEHERDRDRNYQPHNHKLPPINQLHQQPAPPYQHQQRPPPPPPPGPPGMHNSPPQPAHHYQDHRPPDNYQPPPPPHHHQHPDSRSPHHPQSGPGSGGPPPPQASSPPQQQSTQRQGQNQWLNPSPRPPPPPPPPQQQQQDAKASSPKAQKVGK